MKRLWILAAAFVLVLGSIGYTLAQSAGPQGHMMGEGQDMMGSGMMGQDGHGRMGGGMMNMIQGQPLTPEQLEQFARQHEITTEQAKQMTDTCAQIMGEAQGQQQSQ